MSQDGTAVGIVFGAIGLLAVGLGVVKPVLGIRRARLDLRTLAEGLSAEARCLETYTTQERDPSSRRTRTERHVILGFRTRDGAEVRLEDTSGAPRVVGDRVTVRYLPDRPHRAVVVDRARAGIAARIAGDVLIGLLVVACGTVFAISGYNTFQDSRRTPLSPRPPVSTPTSTSADWEYPPATVCTNEPGSGLRFCPHVAPTLKLPHMP
ncbi:DUF3592 domain-containing protein [Kitasatospora sp. NPDC001547]|uniref:DUF3592 domain-containing protein n=1 Tax=Kitasatospora sp. NPDC001547 TaxID=3364015 RepID=UPI003678C2DC|nr:hypothetical protein KitaXyl93_16680 [Kitasatospora sp. Xyl93]